MRTKTTISAYSFIVLACCITCFSSVNAQQKNDLVYRQGGLGKKYFLNDVKISKRNVARLLEKEDKEAYKVFKSARVCAITGTLIGLPSIVILEFGALSVLFSDPGEKGQPGLVIAGSIGTIGGLILVIIGNSKFKKAANIYNHTNSSTGKVHLNFGLTRTGGVGLTVSL